MTPRPSAKLAGIGISVFPSKSNMPTEPTDFIVDDDQAVRDSLRSLVESVGIAVRTYSSAQAFLDDYDPRQTGCLVLDVRMPGASGIELQERLRETGSKIPIIVMTGHADVVTAVRAMKAGAVDFLEKPFSDQLLLDQVHRCIERDAERRAEDAEAQEIIGRRAELTPRQRRVMDMVVGGERNRVIAQHLGISLKTVEAHRAKVMEKMRAHSVAELVKLAALCETRR